MIRDQLASVGATSDDGLMVKIALNSVTEEWETFVQGILGRTTLPSWEDMWAAPRQEEIRQWTKARSSNKGIKVKEEEEYAALASKG